jgi:hypothetical protein
MPKIVILGKCNNGEYVVDVPKRVVLDGKINTEECYKVASVKHFKAIAEADFIIVYGAIGDHTKRDIEYATTQGKQIIYLSCTKGEDD